MTISSWAMWGLFIGSMVGIAVCGGLLAFQTWNGPGEDVRLPGLLLVSLLAAGITGIMHTVFR